jgi:hypothetical protein
VRALCVVAAFAATTFNQALLSQPMQKSHAKFAKARGVFPAFGTSALPEILAHALLITYARMIYFRNGLAIAGLDV